MRIVLVCMVILGSMTCHAQNLASIQENFTPAVPGIALHLNRAEPVIIPGTRMRNTGRILTIAGIPVLIGGIILAATAESTHYTYNSGPYGDYEEGDAQGAFGVVMAVGGAGMIVPGAILWSKGAKKMKRYKEIEGISINYTGTTVALRYNF